MTTNIEKEREQAQRRLESLIRRNASEWDIKQAKEDVQRLAKRAKKSLDRNLDRATNEW